MSVCPSVTIPEKTRKTAQNSLKTLRLHTEPLLTHLFARPGLNLSILKLNVLLLLLPLFIRFFPLSLPSGAREDLADMFIVHQLEEIQGLIEAHNQFKNTLGAADAEFVAVEGLVQQVQTIATKYGLGRDAIENPYTNLTITVGGSMWEGESRSNHLLTITVGRFFCKFERQREATYIAIMNLQNKILVKIFTCN